MVIKVKGIIEFEPEHKTKKHLKQSEWKKNALILTNCDLEMYYAWFLKKRFNLILNKTIRGPHISFISDRIEEQEKLDIFNKAKEKYDGKEIVFYHELEPKSSGEHWWLRAFCPEAEDIREEAGLTRIPYFSFHLTLGYANEKNIEHSKYVLEQCKKFELISSEVRKPLETHTIYEF